MATNNQPPSSVLLSEENKRLLECPVCFEIPKVNRIYQCENGHMVCVDCYSKLPNAANCPQCQMKMFKTRFNKIVSDEILPK